MSRLLDKEERGEGDAVLQNGGRFGRRFVDGQIWSKSGRRNRNEEERRTRHEVLEKRSKTR